MTAPSMETITAYLERSMQNCSLSADGGRRRPESPCEDNRPSAEAAIELNSHLSLPYQWEQCLDLKTGEIYYINWRDGTKATEAPHEAISYEGNYYLEGESSEENEDSASDSSSSSREEGSCEDEVLVAAGCKICLMYFMLPKRVNECPKCNGLLLHFDRPENGYF